MKAALELDIVEVRRLIRVGVDLNAGEAGYTALYRSISVWHEEAYEVARVLLEAGANPNQKQGDSPLGPTPLGLAAGHKLISMVELLLEFGADVDFAYGLHIAATGRPTKRSLAVVKMLIDAGGSVRLSEPDSDMGELPIDTFELCAEYIRRGKYPLIDDDTIREMRALLAI